MEQADNINTHPVVQKLREENRNRRKLVAELKAALVQRDADVEQVVATRVAQRGAQLEAEFEARRAALDSEYRAKHAGLDKDAARLENLLAQVTGLRDKAHANEIVARYELAKQDAAIIAGLPEGERERAAQHLASRRPAFDVSAPTGGTPEPTSERKPRAMGFGKDS
jgi:ATPase subunit of ABC transporter with duplicated ATPase domains